MLIRVGSHGPTSNDFFFAIIKFLLCNNVKPKVPSVSHHFLFYLPNTKKKGVDYQMSELSQDVITDLAKIDKEGFTLYRSYNKLYCEV